MKKYTSLLFGLAILFTVNCSGGKPVFMDVNWNTTANELTNQTEGEPQSFFIQENGSGMISYAIEIEDIAGTAQYEFTDGKLDGITIEFEGTYDPGKLSEFQPQYETLYQFLTDEYGEAYTNIVVEESQYSGYRALWKNQRNANIKLQLDEYNHGIIYFGMKFSRS